MSEFTRALGCVLNSVHLVICLVILAAVIGGPVLGFWRAGGGVGDGLGLLALLLGNAYVWGGWGRRKTP